MVCEINWVVRDMCMNIRKISITRTDRCTLGAERHLLVFDGTEVKDVMKALQIKGYMLSRNCMEYTDNVQNKDLGRMYLSCSAQYIKVYDNMLFVHGQCIGIAEDVDCVYSSDKYHCLYNNGTGTLYRVDEATAVSYKTGLHGRVFNYKDILLSLDESDILSTVSISDTQIKNKVRMNCSIEVTSINNETAYIITNGRFKSVPVSELLRGKILC